MAISDQSSAELERGRTVRLNTETRDAWNALADDWDALQGESGNMWPREIIVPPTLALLDPQPGQRVLEVACGNGQFARAIAGMGVSVVAADFAEKQLVHARERAGDEPIDFRLLDATDADQLRSLGPERFDAAVCNMAIMDMADVEPLLQVLPELLRPGAPFVFSILHPCFSTPATSIVAERFEAPGLPTRYAVKMSGYKSIGPRKGEAMIDQKELQWYFHRSLEALLGMAFGFGWSMDGIAEPTKPEGISAHLPGWAEMPDIPPIVVARLKAPG